MSGELRVSERASSPKSFCKSSLKTSPMIFCGNFFLGSNHLKSELGDTTLGTSFQLMEGEEVERRGVPSAEAVVEISEVNVKRCLLYLGFL